MFSHNWKLLKHFIHKKVCVNFVACYDVFEKETNSSSVYAIWYTWYTTCTYKQLNDYNILIEVNLSEQNSK